MCMFTRVQILTSASGEQTAVHGHSTASTPLGHITVLPDAVRDIAATLSPSSVKVSPTIICHRPERCARSHFDVILCNHHHHIFVIFYLSMHDTKQKQSARKS